MAASKRSLAAGQFTDRLCVIDILDRRQPALLLKTAVLVDLRIAVQFRQRRADFGALEQQMIGRLRGRSQRTAERSRELRPCGAVGSGCCSIVIAWASVSNNDW